MTQSSGRAVHPGLDSNARPRWLRVLLWMGAAFLLFNTVGLALFFLVFAVAGAAVLQNGDLIKCGGAVLKW